MLLPAQDEPRRPEHRHVAAEHAPASVHAQVAPQDEPTLETQQQVLADGLDALEPTSLETRAELLHSRAGMRRLDLKLLPDEHLQAARGAVDRVPFRHAGKRMHAAVAGAVAATVWGLQEPLDRRVFRCDYSDVRLVRGLPVHALNGALFGLAFDAVRRRTHAEPRRVAVTL